MEGHRGERISLEVSLEANKQNNITAIAVTAYGHLKEHHENGRTYNTCCKFYTLMTYAVIRCPYTLITSKGRVQLGAPTYHLYSTTGPLVQGSEGLKNPYVTPASHLLPSLLPLRVV